MSIQPFGISDDSELDISGIDNLVRIISSDSFKYLPDWAGEMFVEDDLRFSYENKRRWAELQASLVSLEITCGFVVSTDIISDPNVGTNSILDSNIVKNLNENHMQQLTAAFDDLEGFPRGFLYDAKMRSKYIILASLCLNSSDVQNDDDLFDESNDLMFYIAMSMAMIVERTNSKHKSAIYKALIISILRENGFDNQRLDDILIYRSTIENSLFLEPLCFYILHLNLTTKKYIQSFLGWLDKRS